MTNAGSSSGTGSVPYAAELIWAIVFVAVALGAAVLVWRAKKQTPHTGLITGMDNRRSTGKAIAVAWTAVVAWMVAAEGLVAAFGHTGHTFSELLSSASDLYFVFLGGPFAAAAFAKASVQTKITQGTLTKSTGTPSFADLISDDNGNADLYDFQYVLFNVLAMLIVIFSFGAHPGDGLPQIPAFLAILAGGSALTYTVNKAIAADVPQITNVDPPKARVGDIITITGVQLFSTTAGGALPTVTIGGISATNVAIPPGKTDTLTAEVADTPSGTPLAGAQDVVVSPPQASPITARNAITILADEPAIAKVSGPVKANSSITVTGMLLLAPGTPADTVGTDTPSIGGVTLSLTTATGQSWPISFNGPYTRDEVTLHVGDQPAGLGAPGTTGKATLVLARVPGKPAQAAVDYEVT